MSIRRVAIAGDGPAGTTLAALLARSGVRVALFARGRPPMPLVGESLVPAVVPILRELGVEGEVREYAARKPGATFVVDDTWNFAIDFDEACSSVPPYAYNVPRDRFDATLLAACEREGARIVPGSARLEVLEDGARKAGPRVCLAEPSAAEARAALGGEPDWVVDATGRSRQLARLLSLPTRTGARRDEAIFAHWKGVPVERAGHVHSDRIGCGWAWRIPLPHVVSLGVVAPAASLRRHGETAEARYEAVLRAEPHLAKLVAGAHRVSPVARYTNYQLVTLRGVGDGWALVGDAFGFVDPVFSSGLFLAMEGAVGLCRALVSGSRAARVRYERRHLRHLEAWQRAAHYFYDGRFFALWRLGQAPADHALGRVLSAHVGRTVPRVFTGEATAGRYAPWLLDVMMARLRSEPDLPGLRVSG